MDSARTAWAEGTEIDAETIEALTVIAEEATARAIAGGCGEPPMLPPGDIWNAWAPELDSFGFEDLADRVRALDAACMPTLERIEPSAIDPATRRELARVDILAAVRALGVIARQPRTARGVCAIRVAWLGRLREACGRALLCGTAEAMVREYAGDYAAEAWL